MTYNGGTKNRTGTDYIVVHCAATKPSQNIDIAEIDRWHRQRGFKCVGYHYFIRRDGTLEDGRPVEQIGAHVVGFNANSVGVCMAGGVSEADVTKAENNFTPKQLEVLRFILEKLQKQYPKAEVKGHRDFPNVAKACPSFDVRKWMSTWDPA